MVGYIGNLGHHNAQQLDAFLPNWPQIVRAAVPRTLHTVEFQALIAAAATIEKRVERVGWTTLMLLCDRILEMDMSTSSRISLMTSTLPLHMDKAQEQFSQMVAEEIDANPATITVSPNKGERETISTQYMQAALDRTLDLIQDNWELLNKASREDDFAFDADKFKAFRERCVIQVVGVGYMPQGEQIEFQIPGPVFKR